MATLRQNIMRRLMNSAKKRANPWLCFTAEEDGCTIKLNKVGSPGPVQLETSINGGKTWVPYSWSGNTGATINLNRGDKCYWIAASLNSTFSTSASDYYRFVNTGSMSISGEVSSLLERDGVTSIPDWAFFYLFRECAALTGVVEIKAREVNFRSLQRLFQGCTSLEIAPDLPARILGENCYQAMFQGCTSLRVAPKLLVTALSAQCYYQMFQGCTSLEIAPDLPAETLVNRCYYQMFQGCTSLCVVRVKFKEWTSATQGWLDGVAATGTFYCPDELSDPTTRGASTVPEGWKIVRPIDGYVKEGLVFQLDSKVGKTATTWTDLIGGVVLDEYGQAEALNFPPGYTIEVCTRGVRDGSLYYRHFAEVSFGEGKAYLRVEADVMYKRLPGGEIIQGYGHWVKTNEIEEYDLGDIGTNQEVVTFSAPTTGQTIHVNGNAVTLDAGTNTDSGGTYIDTDILSVRVYNRALTDAERLQNYQTDQQRFG